MSARNGKDPHNDTVLTVEPPIYNGPSEKRTTSLKRTHSLLRNEITIVIVLKQPPRNGRFSIPDSGQDLHSQLHFSIQNCL